MDIIKEKMLGITAEIAGSVEFSFSEVHISHGAYFGGKIILPLISRCFRLKSNCLLKAALMNAL